MKMQKQYLTLRLYGHRLPRWTYGVNAAGQVTLRAPLWGLCRLLARVGHPPALQFEYAYRPPLCEEA